jgi:hypothetical protein
MSHKTLDKILPIAELQFVHLSIRHGHGWGLILSFPLEDKASNRDLDGNRDRD